MTYQKPQHDGNGARHPAYSCHPLPVMSSVSCHVICRLACHHLPTAQSTPAISENLLTAKSYEQTWPRLTKENYFQEIFYITSETFSVVMYYMSL